MSNEIIVYATPHTVAQDSVRYAGFWMRFWAYIADLTIVFSINGILLIPLKLAVSGEDIFIWKWTLAGVISTIVLYAYFLLMTRFYSQTLGKMIFGLKVVRQDGGRLRWSDLLFREIIGRFLYRVLSITVLLYVVVAFDNRKKGIHDMIADTYVIISR